MSEKNRACVLGCILLSSAVLLPGCDRVRTLTGKLKPESSSEPTAGSYGSDQIKIVDSSNYAQFVSQRDKLLIVDFYADWCGPCRQLSPVLEKATQAHPGVVYLGKVNVDKAAQLAAEQQVSSIPDVRIFKNGRQVGQFVGFPGEAEVLEKIATLAEGIVPAPAPSPVSAPAEPPIKPMEKDWKPAGLEKR